MTHCVRATLWGVLESRQGIPVDFLWGQGVRYVEVRVYNSPSSSLSSFISKDLLGVVTKKRLQGRVQRLAQQYHLYSYMQTLDQRLHSLWHRI